MIDKYRDNVSIIPGGVIQFLEFPIDLNRVRKLTNAYAIFDAPSPKHENQRTIRAVYEDKQTGDFLDVETRCPLREIALEYGQKLEEPQLRITPTQVAERVDGKWLPLPYFRTAGLNDEAEQRFRFGPTDWVRARLDSRRGAEGDSDYILTLAIDTEVMEDIAVNHVGPLSGYPCMAAEDVLEGAEYLFFSSIKDNYWYTELSWVNDWLLTVVGGDRTRTPTDSSQAHIGFYLAFLELLNETVPGGLPALRVVNPSGAADPIDVDLVLDIGNSRSIGMLVERNTQGLMSLDQGEIFQLRDLSSPSNNNANGTFSSYLCFSKADFGDPGEHSLQSGRFRPAFSWPSPSRVGDEAERIANAAKNAQGQTSSSSPKRYLWDFKPARQEWRFASHSEQGRETPVNTGDFARFINDNGMPLYNDRNIKYKWIGAPKNQPEFPVTEPKFCRSSLMMFFIAELITQALTQIASPKYRQSRGFEEIPRRLGNLVITTPPAMTIVERKIFENWVNVAIDNIWNSFDWRTESEIPYINIKKPNVRMQLDEASATQLVFIYDQIQRKFSGDATDYFNRFGKKRNINGKITPSLRVASVDIGGGTTDMVITTYLNEAINTATRLTPIQEFREGFNFAGDDILKSIIENHILPSLALHVESEVNGSENEYIHKKFGQNVAGLSQKERQLRAQFTQQILVPIALTLLQQLERLDITQCYSKTCQVPVVETLKIDPEEKKSLIKYVFSHRENDFPHLFNSWVVVIQAAILNQTILEAISPYMRDLGELIQKWECDFLLLAGRPTRLPIIQTIFKRLSPIQPSRLIPMSEYQIGAWYPFWLTPDKKIADPKTTCVVGALVSALSEGTQHNFFFNSEKLYPASTIRYIGTMDNDSMIRNESLLFNGTDVSTLIDHGNTCELQITTLTQIGFRQLGVARWKTTPLYYVGLASEARTNRLPYTLTIEYMPNELSTSDTKMSENNSSDGLLQLVEIRDREGENVPRSHIDFQFRSSWNDGHWLDTGLFTP